MGISKVVIRLEVQKRRTGWWITGVTEYWADGSGPYTECGPYETKQEAQSDRNGLERTLKELSGYAPEIREEQTVQAHTEEEFFW